MATLFAQTVKDDDDDGFFTTKQIQLSRDDLNQSRSQNTHFVLPTRQRGNSLLELLLQNAAIEFLLLARSLLLKVIFTYGAFTHERARTNQRDHISNTILGSEQIFLLFLSLAQFQVV